MLFDKIDFDVNCPVPALYVNPPSVLGGKLPVGDSKSATEQVVLVVSSTFIFSGIISALPSNDTPPIFLAVVKVAAEPVVFWLPVAFTPGKLISVLPSNETPPIVLAFAKAVAVAALPQKHE